MVNCGILVLCGLPGSGKSSLAKTLLADDHSKVNKYKFVHVEYDKLLPAHLERSLISDGNRSYWKDYRTIILRNVEMCIHKIKENTSEAESNIEKDDSSISNSIKTCTDTLANVQDDQCKIGSDVQNECENDVFSADDITSSLSEFFQYEIEKDMKYILMIDDNMYYSSMRYDYYQLARTYNLAFTQVYVKCTVDTALERNSQRPSGTRVKDDVIKTMAFRLEVPDLNHKWQANTVTLTVEETSAKMHELFIVMSSAFDNPVKPEETVDEVAQEQSRFVCSQSYIHQIDQITRKKCSELITYKKDILSKDDCRVYAKQVMNVRQTVLKAARNSEMSCPAELVSYIENSSKDSQNLFYLYVCRYLEEQLSSHSA